MSQISTQSFEFLKQLQRNNNRDWFNDHKDEYVKAHENIISFAESLLEQMNKHDNIETPTGKKSLHRIYRDIRFSKNKTPYKINWSGGFKRATEQLRGGYYFHLQPGNSFVGGGFWGPNKDDMKLIRQELAADADELREILKRPDFRKTFGELIGEQLKTAPRDYPKDHPNIDLLRMKQFLVIKRFTDEEVLAPDFYKTASKTFRKMRPFFNFMSEVLTTDANGEPLY